jgi:DNA-binding NarL/FixJ family response regulator
MSSNTGVCVPVMGCRTAHADSIDARPSRRDTIRPIVLLAIEDDEVRARFAYQLTASGFDVVTDIANLLHAYRPDVVVAEFDGTRPSGGSSIANVSNDRLRGIPVIAVADDVSDITRTVARQGGCAAVCLTRCSSTALAAGIHAVLDCRER